MRYGTCLVLVVCGCGAPALPTKPAPPPVQPANTPVANVAVPKTEPVEKPASANEPWGTVKGRIVWGGAEIPKRAAVTVPPTHADHKFCQKDGDFLEDTWIVDAKTKGLKNVFVWLAPADPGTKLAIHPNLEKIADSDRKVAIDQPVCTFVPHALAMREGQVLVVKNSSKVLHNFKWGGNPEVNPGGNSTIVAGQQLELKDIKADRNLILAECGIHPWMRASIMAFDHPYFAVTDEHGRFEFKDAPAGPCKLMARHSTGIFLGGKKGRDGRPIEIQNGTSDLGALEFPPPAP